ncbi:hypothetical protein Nmel_005020 [Mimus melanotis]
MQGPEPAPAGLPVPAALHGAAGHPHHPRAPRGHGREGPIQVGIGSLLPLGRPSLASWGSELSCTWAPSPLHLPGEPPVVDGIVSLCCFGFDGFTFVGLQKKSYFVMSPKNIAQVLSQRI